MSDKIIDVGYKELKNDGTEKIPTFLSIGEIAQELDVPTSTIRYWSNKYSHLLDTERCNTHRRYSKTDIEKLRLVRDLSEKNYTHDHIIHELENFKLDITSMTNSINIKPESANNPLQVQILAEAIANEMAIKIREQLQGEFDTLKNELISNNQKYLDEIKSEVGVALDEKLPETIRTHHKALGEEFELQGKNILANQMEAVTGQINRILDTNNQKQIDRDVEISKQLQEALRLKKEEVMKDELEMKNKKSLLGRLFGK